MGVPTAAPPTGLMCVDICKLKGSFEQLLTYHSWCLLSLTSPLECNQTVEKNCLHRGKRWTLSPLKWREVCHFLVITHWNFAPGTQELLGATWTTKNHIACSLSTQAFRNIPFFLSSWTSRDWSLLFFFCQPAVTEFFLPGKKRTKEQTLGDSVQPQKTYLQGKQYSRCTQGVQSQSESCAQCQLFNQNSGRFGKVGDRLKNVKFCTMSPHENLLFISWAWVNTRLDLWIL